MAAIGGAREGKPRHSRIPRIAAEFREYLDNSLNRLLLAGREVTNKFRQIERVDVGPPSEAGDPANVSGMLHIGKAAGLPAELVGAELSGPVETYNLYRIDLAGPHDRAVPVCEGGFGPQTTALVPDVPGIHAFLIVARNAVGDGSFDEDSLGRERPSPGPGAVCP